MKFDRKFRRDLIFHFPIPYLLSPNVFDDIEGASIAEQGFVLSVDKAITFPNDSLIINLVPEQFSTIDFKEIRVMFHQFVKKIAEGRNNSGHREYPLANEILTGIPPQGASPCIKIFNILWRITSN